MGMLAYTAAHGHKLRESYFTAVSAAGGLASLDEATSYSATKALINIFNSASSSAGDRQWIVLDYIRLTCNAINTSATNMTFTGVKDNIDRYSSGGTKLTPKSTAFSAETSYADRTPKATVYAGELTLAAAGADEILFDLMGASTILAIDDVIEIWFGENSGATSDSQTQSRHVITAPPVWIGPGANFSLHEVSASQAADPKFEFEIGFIETGHPRFGS